VTFIRKDFTHYNKNLVNKLKVDYIDRNNAPPAEVLSNTVPNHGRVPRLELRPAAKYLGLNSAPPATVLSNTVPNHSSLQKMRYRYMERGFILLFTIKIPRSMKNDN